MSETTSRRLSLHFGGYHPIAPDEAQRRFSHELDRFSKAWSISTTLSAGAETECVTQWNILASAPGWNTETSYTFFRWDDVIAQERTRGWFNRLWLGLKSGADFLVHGAVLGYLRHSWRYSLFFLYPFLSLALIFAGAWGLARLILGQVVLGQLILGQLILGFSGQAGMHLWSVLLAAGIFSVILPVVGNRIYLDHLIDDWIHAAQLARMPDPQVVRRINMLSEQLMQLQDRELLVFGHSLGAVHAVEFIDRLISEHPDGPPIRFATAGSSILKIGLHAKALWLREAIGRIARSPRVIWVDFQALNDVMNFHRSEPVAALGQQAPPAIICNVRFRAGILPDRYRRMERNFFRLHNQFVHANDLRARYDFVMILAGPFPLEHLAQSGEGAMPWIGPSGELTAAGHAVLSGAHTT